MCICVSAHMRFGDDQRGRVGCYELTGKWQREFCGRSVSGWEANETKNGSDVILIF